MATSTALPQTLKSITVTKVAEVAKTREKFEASRTKITGEAKSKSTAWDKADTLLSGLCDLNRIYIPDEDDSDTEDIEPTTASGKDLRNKRRFLQQAKKEPSFSEDVLNQFSQELGRDLELEKVKHEHTLFFSNLVTEWLDEYNPPDSADASQVAKPGSSTPMDSSFEEIGRKEMHEQRMEWERLVFEKGVDPEPVAIKAYLDKLFKKDKTCIKALESLRSSIKNFSNHLEYTPETFTAASLKQIIANLRKSDLLFDNKKGTLREFSVNNEVAKEVADVINLKLRSIDSWDWAQEDGIPLEMRRQLNGKYRVFMDEDVLDAILLQWIGETWARKFKGVFETFFQSGAWRKTSRTVSKEDQERRSIFLANTGMNNPQSISEKRKATYKKDYFMTQLPSESDRSPVSYDGEDSDSDSEPGQRARKGPLETKHSLLHLLITEAIMGRRLHGDHTVIRSDFRWFGPSLPHSSIFTVFEYFGMTKTWLEFFRRFLAAPLKFAQDGPAGQVRRRKRGVPMSHVISDVMGEAVLFCMDFTVNQHSNGEFLYRLHDDFWFWGSRQVCQRAWRSMEDFTDFMGLQFNEEKTGSVSMGPSAGFKGTTDDSSSEDESDSMVVDDNLPKGEVRWGFLKLDAKSTRFVLDQAMVDTHILELKRQLSSRQSIFSWIQAYNHYFARFFSNNFGKPSVGFGKTHIDMMIDTLSRIQRELFSDHSTADFLRERIASKFGVTDLPEGLFYFPVELGGLGLRNPFIPLFAMREQLRRSPEKILEKGIDSEAVSYSSAKDRFERREVTDISLTQRVREDDTLLKIKKSGWKFMSLEEYGRYYELTSHHLADVYDNLLSIPLERHVATSPELAAAWAKLNNLAKIRKGKEDLTQNWHKLDPYWKWVTSLYYSGMMQKYGSLAAVDKDKVPLGVLNVLRAGKVRWEN